MRPYISRRLVKWLVKLNKFDLKYRPGITIKAYTLTNFIVE